MSIFSEPYNENLNQLQQLKSCTPQEFKDRIICMTLESLDYFDASLPEFKLNDISITQHDLFLVKKEDVEKFWTELLNKNTKRLDLHLIDALVIPTKIHLLKNTLPKSTHLTLSEEEIFDVVNKYKMLFEAVLSLLVPYFEQLLISERKKHIEWSDISKHLRYFNLKYNKLFKSMNGPLRNAIAHESYMIENNYILWIQDSNKQKQYSLKKIFDKIFDLYALLIALYWGYCNVYAPHAIKGYNQTPAKKLKNSFNRINLNKMKIVENM